MKLQKALLGSLLLLMPSALLLAQPADIPPMRIYHKLVHHTKTDLVLLFGGFSRHGTDVTMLRDFWAYNVDANTWERLNNVPAGVAASDALAYDEESNRMIVYDMVGDTWAYELETDSWTRMAPPQAPGGLWGSRMAYDAESDRVVLFGGVSEFLGAPFGDTWAYDYNADRWTMMTPAESPSPRIFFEMAYDAESDRIILWGGRPVSDSSDVAVWAYDYDSDTWTAFEPSSGPERRFAYPSMAYHPGTDRVIMFGGLQLESTFRGRLIDQTWAYDLNTNTWTEMTRAGPRARSHLSMACVHSADRIVLFGGEYGSAYSNQISRETWIYDATDDEWIRSTDFEPPGLIADSDFDHVSGISDALLYAHVDDPSQLTGDRYRVTFNDTLFPYKVYDVINVSTGEKVLESATQTLAFRVLVKGPRFDGIRLMLKDYDPPVIDKDRTGWALGTSTLAPRISPANALWPPHTIRGVATFSDYSITIADQVVDTSVAFSHRPAVPVNFSVRNTTEDRKVSFVFHDPDTSNSISYLDEIYFLEPDSSGGLQFTWSMIFRSLGRTPPLPGDAFTFVTFKPLTGDDVYEFSASLPTSIARDNDETRARSPAIFSNYPNPFHPPTTISYFLPTTEHVTVSVFNVLGQRVRTLVNERAPAGLRRVLWDGRDDSGIPVSSGVYLVHVETGHLSQTRKMVLVR